MKADTDSIESKKENEQSPRWGADPRAAMALLSGSIASIGYPSRLIGSQSSITGFQWRHPATWIPSLLAVRKQTSSVMIVWWRHHAHGSSSGQFLGVFRSPFLGVLRSPFWFSTLQIAVCITRSKKGVEILILRSKFSQKNWF